MKRLAALWLLALVLTACGGNDAAEPNTPAQTPVLAGQPTAVQLEFREQLLEQLRNGTYGDCDCNGDERARERIESGKVKPPPGYQLSTEQSGP